MPLASSNDLILAGIADIVRALRNPTLGSPLHPLSDSQHEALTQLTSIITSVASPITTVDRPSPLLDTSLRVASAGGTTPLPSPSTTPLPPAEAPLRVEMPSIPKAVQFAPLPSDTGGATFANSTGTKGKQRRRIRRQSIPSTPARPSKTVHPKILHVTAPPTVTPSHSHGTRSKTHLNHIAAFTRALLVDDARAPQSPFTYTHERIHDQLMHYALHGHAINPDTGKIAEYRELSQCSDGAI